MNHRARRDGPGRPPHPDVLTPAEWRVLEYIREGAPNAEIAARLGLSIYTVKTHVSSMLAKLELTRREQLAAWDGEPAIESRSILERLRAGALAPIAALGHALRTAPVLHVAMAVGGMVALGVVAVVAVSGALEDARDETVPGTPTANGTAVPTATPNLDAVRAETDVRARLLTIPAMPEILDAVDEGDAQRLVDIAYEHHRYCGDMQPPTVPPQLASQVCGGNVVAYDGVATGVWPPEALGPEGGDLWTPEAMVEELAEFFQAGPPVLLDVWHEEYRRASLDGYEVHERLQVAWRSGTSRGLVLAIDPGEPEPITGIAFIEREDWPRHAQFTQHDTLQHDALSGLDTDAIETLREVPEVSAVIDAVAAQDVTSLLDIVRGDDVASCIPPPLPGKEIPEVCDQFGMQPYDTYEPHLMAFGTFYSAHRDRASFFLAPLLVDGPPELVRAFKVTSSEGEHYTLVFQGLPISATNRNDSLNLGYWYWDGFALTVVTEGEQESWFQPIMVERGIREFRRQWSSAPGASLQEFRPPPSALVPDTHSPDETVLVTGISSSASVDRHAERYTPHR